MVAGVAIRVDRECGHVRWVLGEVSKYGWRALLDGTETLDSLFDEENELEVVDYGRDGRPIRYSKCLYSELPSALRPLGGLPESERLSLLATVEDLPATRAIIFDGSPVSGHSIGLFALNHAIHAVYGLVVGFATEIKKKLVAGLSEIAEPQLVPIPGSFGLRVDGPDGTAFDAVWDKLGSVLVASNESELADCFEADPRLEEIVAGFLERMKKSRVEFYLKTPSLRMRFSPAGLRRVQQRVESARKLLDKHPVFVDGWFVGFNAGPSSSFTLRSYRDGTDIGGGLSREIRSSVLSNQMQIVMSPLAVYRVRLVRVARRKRGYIATGIELLHPPSQGTETEEQVAHAADVKDKKGESSA